MTETASACCSPLFCSGKPAPTHVPQLNYYPGAASASAASVSANERTTLLDGLTEPKGPRTTDTASRAAIDEELLAQEMNALSVQERETILEEIHGCVGGIQETPEFLAKHLQEMRDAVQRLPASKRKAYKKAVFLQPSLETQHDNDDKYHLMFLRARWYNPQKAAEDMCASLDHKVRLFGEHKVVGRLLMDDFSDIEQQVHIRSMSLQFLPFTDSVGRGILLVTVPKFPLNHDFCMLARYSFYVVHAAMQDNEELQKKGYVQILNCYGKYEYSIQQLLSFVKYVSEFSKCWPGKVCSTHFVCDNPLFDQANALLFRFRGKEFRLRHRTHFGSMLEAQYSLMSYGINIGDCLDEAHYTFSSEKSERYIQERRNAERVVKQQEAEITASRAIPSFLYPIEKDVLMGRGHPYGTWVGNVRLRALILSFIEDYMEARHSHKSKVALEVVHQVLQDGGQFLHRGNAGFWEAVSLETAKVKVSQIFRAEVRHRGATMKNHPRPSVPSEKIMNDDDDDDDDDISWTTFPWMETCHSFDGPIDDENDDIFQEEDDKNNKSKRLRLA